MIFVIHTLSGTPRIHTMAAELRVRVSATPRTRLRVRYLMIRGVNPAHDWILGPGSLVYRCPTLARLGLWIAIAYEPGGTAVGRRN